MYFARMKKVLFVCLGNICRSPLAEGVFLKKLEDNELLSAFSADSAGTASYHIGNLADKRSITVAANNGIKLTHRARAFTQTDFHEFDLIVAMDRNNYHDINKKRPDGNLTKVVLMRDYDSSRPGGDVPDPYYGDLKDFEEVYHILEHACENLIQELKASL